MTARSVSGNAWDRLDGVTPDEPPRVSVVICHYDQQDDLDRCLRGLARQTHPADRLEVIVADDGSPSAPRVPSHVRVVRHPDRGYRPSATRNLGAAAATGDVLVFLDADTAPEPGFVTAIVRLPALLPEAVAVGRRRYGRFAPREDAPAEVLPEPRWLADAYAATDDLLHADDRSYRFVISAVLACSRWLFEHVGGFDATFRSYGGEDWEWASRAWLAGGILAHLPGAVAWHNGPDWEGRADGQAVKNDEAVRLALATPVPGSRGHGVRGRRPDVFVRLPDAGSPGAVWRCVDGLLAALPEATVVVPEVLSAPFAFDQRVVTDPLDALAPGLRAPATLDGAAGARLLLEVHRPLIADPDALRAALQRMGEDLGTLVLTGPGDGAPPGHPGTPLLTVVHSRARARANRWPGGDAHFPTRTESAPWLAPIDGEPDLEAYHGGWD